MPYIFTDDGYPEANEFGDNYQWVERPKPRDTDPIFRRIYERFVASVRSAPTPVTVDQGSTDPRR